MNMQGVEELKQFISYGGELNICILDNNTIDFLIKIKEIISADKIFGRYNLILIPGWVEEEINDSEYRKEYVCELSERYKLNKFHIKEQNYCELVNGLEGDLFNLFKYSVYTSAEITRFINRNIIRGNPIEDLEPYEEWLQKLYNEGLAGKRLSNGRIKRKNAGEISICVLAYILAYYYFDNIENAIIFTHDNDCYDYVTLAGEKLIKDDKFKRKNRKPITFKSNDVLLYEFINNKLIDESEIENILNNVRQERYLRFNRKKSDNSIENQHKLVNNEEFYEIIKDQSSQIIF
ncbi:hypothetical protein CLTEP_25940 [Clostridium tepidiprofundi DSM 19306]|uniref:Uncharacterized protein n=2 Tax=Clostridium TaxID=1485 RepID=A0A151ASB4_9CLOT|nr:hypothetical protein CLTEP_25940 [Clostridium tepidiprofundi DSM 19306]